MFCFDSHSFLCRLRSTKSVGKEQFFQQMLLRRIRSGRVQKVLGNQAGAIETNENPRGLESCGPESV